MALSGQINGVFAGKPDTDNRKPLIIWSGSQGADYTDVTAYFIFWQRTSTYWAYNLTTSGASAHLNTTNVGGTTSQTITPFDTRNKSGNITLRTVTVRINHDDNGAATCYIGWSGDTHTSNTTYSFGDTVTLDTIATLPTCTTSDASSVGSTTVTLGGNVTNQGAPLSDTVAYYIKPAGGSYSLGSSKSGGAGAFSFNVTGLSAGTTYYFKAAVINNTGTGYGVEKSFTTLNVATVSTSAASSIDRTSCTANGNITATGGATVTRRGFCYMTGTSGDPTTSNSTAYDDGSFGTGAYSKSITGLSANTVYRIRAYAVNSAGTSYGTTVSVTTYDFPTVTTQACSSVTHNSATANGNITSIGGTSVTRRGFCYIQASSGDPTVSDSVVYDNGSFTTGTYTEGLSGLSTATDYRVRAYAINAIGTSYGTTVALTTEEADTPLVTSDGVKFTSKMTTLLQGEVTDKRDFDVTERGFYWGETAETMTNKITVVLSSGLGTFIYRLTGLTAGTTYYYYAYATSSAGTGHGDTIEFKTAGANPAVGGKYPLPPNDVEGI